MTTKPGLAVLSALVSVLAATASGQNQAVNPGFVSDLTGWTVLSGPELMRFDVE